MVSPRVGRGNENVRAALRPGTAAVVNKSASLGAVEMSPHASTVISRSASLISVKRA